MPENAIICPACGAPTYPEAGASQMPCAYCGTNLTVPKDLQTKASPKVEKRSPKPNPAPPVQDPEVDVSDVLRQVQPAAIRAWNLYAYWTWLRWALPACLTIFVVVVLLCVALGMAPFIWNWSR